MAQRKESRNRKNTPNSKKNRQGRRNGLGILVLCLFLILAAVFGGYALANSIRNGGVNKGTDKNENKGNGVINTNDNTGGNGTTDNDGKTADSNTGTGTIVLSKTPVEVIYDVNFETGRIDEILIGIMRTTEGKIDYIRIDTDVVYTMSANLYSSLTPDNTTLPQTVTFSELYRYYHNNKAFDAGRRIISEMLSFSIYYYSAMPDYDFEKLFSTEKDDEGTDIDFAVSPARVKSDYGTEQSTKGFIEDILKNTLTNWSIDERLRYLDTLDDLEYEDVSFTDAPVYEMNESCRLDTDAAGRILYDILY